MSGSKSTKATTTRSSATNETKAPKSKVKSNGPKKPPNAYNKFMQTELPKVKAENPTLQHKDAFKLVASRWKDSPENPKNNSTGGAQ
ncbi:13101_t:CDS:2 [Ambispora gerdemannii]|uniref:13101_t:CDS:1 n=1 Tax=Ambispora gerdemannii TaxID=144530 RepID=A0A9N9BAX4_9GLOM|nr:13101_t:CDS:2 [Ambispora gerdemannii]